MLKKIIYHCILCTCILIHQKNYAQTYEIPDPNFKSYLATNIPWVLNANQDLIINNAKNYAGTISCSGLTIQNLSGIQFFYKITLLNCSNNQLTSLPALDSLKQLQFLWAHDNKLASLPKVNHMVNLQTLNVKNNLLTNLPSLTGMGTLKTLDCSINKLIALPDLNTLTNLQELYCYTNSIATIPTVTNLVNLKIFNVERNLLSHLPDISLNTKIEILQFDYNQIDVIPTLNSLTALKQLIFNHNNVSILPDLSANTNLTLIIGNNNPLKQLPDLSVLSNLIDVKLMQNQFSFEDLLPSSDHPQFATVFHIQPQDSLNTLQLLSVVKGSTVTLALNFDLAVSGSTYNWYKNNTYIATTTTPSLILQNVNTTNAGSYYCTITNSTPALTGITLNARSYKISIEPCITFSSIDYEIVSNDCSTGADILIDNAQITAPNAPLSYSLMPLNNQVPITSASPLLNDIMSGRYSLTISDVNNCSVDLQNYISIPVPTGCTESFTPNGDGLEDVFFIDRKGSARIYNKTGTLIRTITTPAGWDGSDDSGKLAPMGYYIIIIDGKEKMGVVLIN